MSEVDARFVKRGFWVNVEDGEVMGQTITTDIQIGTVVIALLAILSSLATSHLWNILAFAYHQIRANGRPADGLHWQQQVLLRSLPPPSSLLADWIKLWWLWRKKSKRAFLRSFPQGLVALLFSVAPIAIGIVSSYIVTSTNMQVIVESPLCGPLNLDPASENFTSNLLGIIKYRRDLQSRSVPFAQECYQNTTSLSARCMAFIRPTVPLAVERIPCPFDKKICIDGESPGVSVDSGLVDTNEVFGWNMKARDRISYRRKATCGVLRSDGYSEIVQNTTLPFIWRPPFPDEQWQVTYYGPSVRDDIHWRNVTFAYSLMDSNSSRKYGIATTTHFVAPEWNDVASSHETLPETESDTADLMQVLIRKNLVRYLHPIDDPVFSAHTQYTQRLDLVNEGNHTTYLSDSPHSAISCRQQYQFCHARAKGSDHCTDMTGLPGKIRPEEFPEASELQLSALQLLLTTTFLYDTSDAALAGLEVDRIMGDSTGYIDNLPDDQWVREILEWEKLIWASRQVLVSDYAIGYNAREDSIREYIRKDLLPGERQLCATQRMRKNGGFVNINVFALTFIITFSVIITVADLVMLKFVIFLTRVRKAMSPRIDRWIQDGVFQLQRRSFEIHGQWTWQRLDKEVPSTYEAYDLDELPLRSQLPAYSSHESQPFDLKSRPTNTTLVVTESKHDKSADFKG